MMHVRNANSPAFRTAVDQCAEVGFEMIIYTFGSGLDQAFDHAIRSDLDVSWFEIAVDDPFRVCRFQSFRDLPSEDLECFVSRQTSQRTSTR